MNDGDWTLRFIESKRSRVVAVWASAALICLALVLVIIAGNEASPTVSTTPIGAVSHTLPTALPAPRSVPKHRKRPAPSTSPAPTGAPGTQAGGSGGVVVIAYWVEASSDSRGQA